jgi:transposase-like protein
MHEKCPRCKSTEFRRSNTERVGDAKVITLRCAKCRNEWQEASSEQLDLTRAAYDRALKKQAQLLSEGIRANNVDMDVDRTKAAWERAKALIGLP